MKTQISIKADFMVELPTLPNFILCGDGTKLDVKDIHAHSLMEIADAWKEALIKHAETRRKNGP